MIVNYISFSEALRRGREKRAMERAQMMANEANMVSPEIAAMQDAARRQPLGASYMQHLDWIENEIQEARRAIGAEDRLVKLAEECVRQAERQRMAAGKRVSALEAEAARTRAAIAGIDQ